MVAGVARYVAGGRTDREEPQAVSSDESSGATSSPDEEEWEEEADLAPPPPGRSARRLTHEAVQADLNAQAHLPPVQRTNGAANEVATEEGEEGEGESDDESDDEELEFPRAPQGLGESEEWERARLARATHRAGRLARAGGGAFGLWPPPPPQQQQQQ